MEDEELLLAPADLASSQISMIQRPLACTTADVPCSTDACASSCPEGTLPEQRFLEGEFLSPDPQDVRC